MGTFTYSDELYQKKGVSTLSPSCFLFFLPFRLLPLFLLHSDATTLSIGIDGVDGAVAVLARTATTFFRALSLDVKSKSIQHWDLNLNPRPQSQLDPLAWPAYLLDGAYFFTYLPQPYRMGVP